MSRLSDIFRRRQCCMSCVPGERVSRGNMVATMAAVLTHESLPLRSVCEQASESLERLLPARLVETPGGAAAGDSAEFVALLKGEAGQLQSHDSIISALEELGIFRACRRCRMLSEEPSLCGAHGRRRPKPSRHRRVASEPLWARRSLPDHFWGGSRRRRQSPTDRFESAALRPPKAWPTWTADAQEEGGEGLSRSA